MRLWPKSWFHRHRWVTTSDDEEQEICNPGFHEPVYQKRPKCGKVGGGNGTMGWPCYRLRNHKGEKHKALLETRYSYGDFVSGTTEVEW